jgi:hypothetical protein
LAVKKLNGRKIFLGERQSKGSFSLRKAKEQSLENLSNNNDVSDLLNKLIDKVDSLGKNSFVNDDYIYKNIKKDTGAIEVDIKKNLFISEFDNSNIKIDNISKGKVNNKLDKLRRLRRKSNG